MNQPVRAPWGRGALTGFLVDDAVSADTESAPAGPGHERRAVEAERVGLQLRQSDQEPERHVPGDLAKLRLSLRPEDGAIRVTHRAQGFPS